MKKILVPVDFSEQSKFASKVANKIAKKSNSEVHLLHLIELPTGIIDMGSGSNFSIPESMLYLRKTRDQIIKFKDDFFDDDVEVNYAIKFQKPHEGIEKYKNKIDADLIIMGSKGHSEFEEMIIGSNTEKIVRTSKIPVLVVKRDDENFKLNDLVFASNFKEDNKDAFSKFIDFANKFNSEIHLVKINTPGKFESSLETKEKIKDFITDYNLPKHTINVYSDVSIEKGILNFSRSIDADIISVTTHGRSGLSHLFNSSVTKNLTKNSLKPMLTFRI